MKGMKIAVVGFGREGRSVLKLLQRHHVDKKNEVVVCDQNPHLRVKKEKSIRYNLGSQYLSDVEKFDVVFRSPGIPYNLPAFQNARRRGVAFSSATKIFFEYCPATVIGVTGTKGKGTVATLLYTILKSARKPAVLAGNIGTPALDVLPRLKKNSFAVLELSSFQLQDLTISPPLAIVLDIFPDHQDYHKSLREYYEAKAAIARYQGPGDTIFFFADDAKSRWVAAQSRGKKIGVNPQRFALFTPNDLQIKGAHNFRNAAMAATVASSLRIPKEKIVKAAKSFRGLQHRLELVRSMGRVKFYSDSASTNPHTASAAIRAFPHEAKILIAGGQDKNLDYAPLSHVLRNSGTKLVVLFGENKKKIEKAIRSSGVATQLEKNLQAAVRTAYRFAERRAPHARTWAVIFSPGAASFDMFRDYVDRGNQFKKLVSGVTRKKQERVCLQLQSPL